MIPPFTCTLPDVPCEELEKRAQQYHARRNNGEPAHRGDIPRIAVNMLRHTATNYDCDQSLARYTAASEAISARYPWLADECARQLRQRANENAWEEDHPDHNPDDDLSTGDDAVAVVYGKHRECVVVEVERRRVLVRFRTRKGDTVTHVRKRLVRRV